MTIKLTTETSFIEKKDNRIYYLTGITEIQKQGLIQAKADKTLDIYSAVLGVPCENILLLGSTKEAKPSNILNYLGYLRGPITDDIKKVNSNRPKHYRLYSIEEKRQIHAKHLLNHCPDAARSARSAFEKIRETYCILWYREVESLLQYKCNEPLSC
jgi:hypothetical protein